MAVDCSSVTARGPVGTDSTLCNNNKRSLLTINLIYYTIYLPKKKLCKTKYKSIKKSLEINFFFKLKIRENRKKKKKLYLTPNVQCITYQIQN